MKILITGQNGFIGAHLYNTIKYKFPSIDIIDFKRDFFDDKEKLDKALSKANFIVHLAGINRHDNQELLYSKNLLLSKTIAESINRINFKGKLVFASSTQESLDTNYGKSKKHSNELFLKLSKANKFYYSGLIIPNVFGPFCKSNYNSFIATFCSNSIMDINNEINKNEDVGLIYIDNLISYIINDLKIQKNESKFVKKDLTVKVSYVKKLIDSFKNIYLDKGQIPHLNSDFDANLFKTFTSYINHENYFPRPLNQTADERGVFFETIRSANKGQYSCSITFPDQIRGNHFHTRKIERFIVIQGTALIKMRKIDSNEIVQFEVDGKEPVYVDMPLWYTHNIKNVGDNDLITLFWINEFYNKSNTDTFFEKV